MRPLSWSLGCSQIYYVIKCGLEVIILPPSLLSDRIAGLSHHTQRESSYVFEYALLHYVHGSNGIQEMIFTSTETLHDFNFKTAIHIQEIILNMLPSK